MALGMSQEDADLSGWRGSDESNLMKKGTSHWASPNSGATNESGFTALPGGRRFGDGSFAVWDYIPTTGQPLHSMAIIAGTVTWMVPNWA